MKKEAAVPDSLTVRGRRRRRGSWLLKVLVLAAVLAVAVFFTWEYLAAAVSKVELLARQEVSISAPLEGLLIKEEKVISSPASGKLRYIAQDGKRLEVGAGAVQVIAAEQDSGETVYNVFTPVAGIFCTHLDGLESVLSPGNLDVLDLPKLEKIGEKPVPAGGRVEKGQPAFKIVDNLSPIYLYAELPKDGFPPELVDKQRWLAAAWENLSLMIKPRKLVDKGDRWEGLFLLKDYPENIVHCRKINLNVTTNKLSGLLVPGRAIVYRDGEPGIYLAVKKRAQWVPVQIEGELGGKVAISGRGLVEGTRYVSNPVLAREGWPVE